MKKTFKKLLLLFVFPIWIILALLQLLICGLYATAYFYRILIYKKDTKAMFATPKQFLNRIFEASDKAIYNPEIKSEIATH